MFQLPYITEQLAKDIFLPFLGRRPGCYSSRHSRRWSSWGCDPCCRGPCCWHSWRQPGWWLPFIAILWTLLLTMGKYSAKWERKKKAQITYSFTSVRAIYSTTLLREHKKNVINTLILSDIQSHHGKYFTKIGRQWLGWCLENLTMYWTIALVWNGDR